jgi:hypothetical protein
MEMTTQELKDEFLKNHLSFIQYIGSLTKDQFETQRKDKWSPGQQLEHIALCTKPLAQLLSAKSVVESKFGKVNRACMNQELVLSMYAQALEKGGKAPERFVPQKIEWSTRSAMSKDLEENLALLVKSLQQYTEEDLNTLIIPHPLLGNLTIREMLYLMSFHVVHHQQKTKENLEL